MSRSIRATVVAATALTTGLLTTPSAHAALPEPITFAAEAFYSQASHSVIDTATGPDGATYLAVRLDGGDFYWGSDGSYRGSTDAVVAKIPAGQSSFAWATTIGGSDADEVQGIAVGKDGHVVITGNTSSMDFPTTPGALRSTAAGLDAFVVRLDGETGAVDWSTLLGGTARDLAWDVAVGPHNRIWVSGATRSSDYPGGGPIVGDGDATLTVLTPNGALHWSAVVGGEYDDYLGRLAVAPDGDVVTSGLVSGLSASVPRTELGSPGADSPALLRWQGSGAAPVLERVTTVGGVGFSPPSALAFRPNGALILAGHTTRTTLPLVHPVQSTPGPTGSAYLLEVAPSGDELSWGTYYGGSGLVQPRAILTDAWGATYVAGMSATTDGQPVHSVQDARGGWDGFAAKFSAQRELVFSTYLVGGTSSDEVDGLRLDSTGVDVFASSTSTAVAGVAEGLPGFGAAILVGHLTEIAHVTAIDGPRRTADRTPRFSFAVDLAGTRNQCRVDKGAWRACTATGFTTAKLERGKHTFAVRALSGPGRVAPVAKRSFRVVR